MSHIAPIPKSSFDLKIENEILRKEIDFMFKTLNKENLMILFNNKNIPKTLKYKIGIATFNSA